MNIRACLLASAAIIAATPALAADYEASTAYDWTGAYLGIHGGYAWGKSKTNDIYAYDLAPESWVGGVQAGYNRQFENRFVLGAEADLSFGDLEDDHLTLTDFGLFAAPTKADVKVQSFGSIRLRAGYAFDRFLPYVTAGLGWSQQKVNYFQDYLPPVPGRFTNDLDDTKTYLGWTVGGGIEAALTDNWTARVEYLYADYGPERYEGNAFGIAYPAKIDLHIQTVRLGINYKFD